MVGLVVGLETSEEWWNLVGNNNGPGSYGNGSGNYGNGSGGYGNGPGGYGNVLVDMAMILAVLADPEAGIAALMIRALSLLFQTPIDLTSN